MKKQLTSLQESDAEIEKESFIMLPVEKFKGRLDINKQRRKGWILGAKHQRDKLIIKMMEILRENGAEAPTHSIIP